MLRGKRILLGICGSIAAYKAAYLVRLLIKEEAEVKVIMTSSAMDFITPLTLATLSKNPVLSKFAVDETGEWNNHVELGLWADAMVIAPASGNTLAKMSNGICDNLLTAVYLSARCPVFVAPAMDLDMWGHPSTQENIRKLSSYGNVVIEPAHGELASGLIGNGRMAEPEEIAERLNTAFKKKSTLSNFFSGKNVLITAGPTYEAIDPVRFIGNHSSGKMGFALASVLSEAGAQVTVVSGPTSANFTSDDIKVIEVVSADEMYEKTAELWPATDLAILAAAVADYKPETPSDQKIKKSGDHLSINLIKTTDIAASLGQMKKKGQVLVGFALETQNEVENALKKLRSKNFDMIVLNSLNEAGAGFGLDTNKITIIDQHNSIMEFPLKSKREVAHDIISAIASLEDR